MDIVPKPLLFHQAALGENSFQGDMVPVSVDPSISSGLAVIMRHARGKPSGKGAFELSYAQSVDWVISHLKNGGRHQLVERHRDKRRFARLVSFGKIFGVTCEDCSLD